MIFKRLPVLYSLIALCLGSAISQHRNLTDLEIKILANPNDYAISEVHEARGAQASTYFITDVNEAIRIFEEDIKNCMVRGATHLAAESSNALGEIYYMQKKTDTAIIHFKESAENMNHDAIMRSDALLRVGNCYLLLNELDSARKYTDLGAKIIFDEKFEPRYTNTYIHMGEIAQNEERFVTAAECYSKALDYDDQAAIPMRKANILMNLGTVYSNLNDPENAKEHLLEGLAIVREFGYKKSESRILKDLGNVESSLGNLDIAIAHYQNAIPYLEETEQNIELIELYCNLCFVYIKKGDLDSAKMYLDKAGENMNDDIIEQFQHAYYAADAEYQLAIGNLAAAQKSFTKQLDISINAGVETKVLNAMGGLMRVAEKRNDLPTELALTKSYYQKKDSLFNLQQSRLIYDYEARYQKAERDVAIADLSSVNEVQHLQLAQQKRQLAYLLFALAIFGLIAFWLYRLYRKLNEQNQIITKANEEKAVLLKEIHHRVKNNLQVVSSLLGLQSRYVKDPSAVEAIKTGRSRVQSMSILHQNLYQNENLKSIELKKYFENLGQNLFETYQLNDKQINFEMDIEDIEMDIDVVVPMGLITNELISNALKHAFKDRQGGEIKLSIKRQQNNIELIVSDDGVGIETTTLPERPKSLGVQLIKSFAAKLQADIEIENEHGTTIKLTFDPGMLSVAAA